MCRLLSISSKDSFDPADHLEKFKQLSKDSREYQGHGWGCAWLDSHNDWQFHHNICPVWEDRKQFPETRLFLAHARSAFRDEGIVVENNMPFYDGEHVFIFNGELRGVRIKAEGRIGAEKIFNTIRRFDKGDFSAAVSRGINLINHKTRYVRALNFIIANKNSVYYCCQFDEDPDYFQLNECIIDSTRVICSQPYSLQNQQWRLIDNHQFGTFAF